MSYAYRTGTVQSQQITTLAKLPTYSLSHIHMTLITSLTAVKCQHNTTSLRKKPIKVAEVIQEWESALASLRG